ncbi:hypothetical protein [Halorubrum sp. AJ67]|uniref:hypothetical protein n=1 Tax=Halorubrum sp. AJ67 TaxID=1173487 RepID=UPI0003DBC7F0|nr:hypothetical protein [Halorubrum sp. AJ67]CDK39325.1 uncharacterized protein BN903_99 [Halorubrum sp. AJ67]
MENRESDTETLELASGLIEQIEARIGPSEFETVDAYVEYVLEEMLYNMDKSDEKTDQGGPSKEDVEDRLKSLGYLS